MARHPHGTSTGGAGAMDADTAGSLSPTQAARYLPCQVDCSGVDAKMRKAAYAAHYRTTHGITTLSASGLLLLPHGPGSSTQHAHVLTPLSLLYPFLTPEARSHLGSITAASLLPGTSLRVLAAPPPSPSIPAQLLGVVTLPRVEAFAGRLLEALNQGGSGGEAAWKLGWRLAAQQPAEAARPELFASWALLRLVQPLPLEAPFSSSCGSRAAAASSGCSALCACARVSSQPLRLVGSPFGCLASLHFHGSVVSGAVANTFQAAASAAQLERLPPPLPPLSVNSLGMGNSSSSGGGGGSSGGGDDDRPPVFLLDAACLPGMEGGLIACGWCGEWAGLVCPPLSSASSQVEAHLALDARHVLRLLEQQHSLQQQQQQQQCAQGQQLSRDQAQQGGMAAAAGPCPAPAAAMMASGSQCWTPAQAAAVERASRGVVMLRVGGSWASGVVLSQHGLLLTNAHLLQPSPQPGSLAGECNGSGGHDRAAAGQQVVHVRLPTRSGGDVWLPASVLALFTGYLDLAVLLLQPGWRGLVQSPLQPLQLALEASLAEGDLVCVLGHGLWGPRMQWLTTTTAGVAARVVALPGGLPSMLLTTAAVHAGASGGAVVDAHGALVGLVTSNARHSGGTTLPRLNFAVHGAELAPLWDWAAGWPGTGASLDALAALDKRDAAGVALWALRDPGDGMTGSRERSDDAAQRFAAKLQALHEQQEGRQQRAKL